ncbi:hypothetical protein BBJ29_006576 [Phytophthora kernoviae]|uniref:Temptin Cys/Cys disulfide domain-containing protein n=1 Tax=Phytophthora kernoviae TaxID=325452 RepID=A0A421FX76_9STRA|nr:hypothetical protein BBJ29_006576 [Phytophthora kernoviae]
MMLLSAGVSTMLLSVVQGVPMFTTRMPNGENVPHTRALGHEDGTGERDARNIFGIAFEEAGTKWTKELCEADSDEDGQTNGQELGDPCCIWKEGDEPLWTKGVSHPGVATQTSNKALWSNIDCVALQTQATVSKTKASTHEPEDDPDDSLLTVENLYRLEDSETEISTGTHSVCLHQYHLELVPNGINIPDHNSTNSTSSDRILTMQAESEPRNSANETPSDNDGQTNGLELGDPCCEWTVGGTPAWTTGISNPGDATSTPDPSRLAAISCVAPPSDLDDAVNCEVS